MARTLIDRCGRSAPWAWSVTILATAIGCANEPTSAETDLCARAADRVEECLGTRVDDTACDADGAAAILDQSCDEIADAKADDIGWLCRIFGACSGERSEYSTLVGSLDVAQFERRPVDELGDRIEIEVEDISIPANGLVDVRIDLWADGEKLPSPFLSGGQVYPGEGAVLEPVIHDGAIYLIVLTGVRGVTDDPDWSASFEIYRTTWQHATVYAFRDAFNTYHIGTDAWLGWGGDSCAVVISAGTGDPTILYTDTDPFYYAGKPCADYLAEASYFETGYWHIQL